MVRSTDRPDMTIAVTMDVKRQHNNNNLLVVDLFVCAVF